MPARNSMLARAGISAWLGLCWLALTLIPLTASAQQVKREVDYRVIAQQPVDAPKLSLSDLLVSEGGNKDKADPPTQKVRDALAKTLTISREQQHLGKPMDAQFCLGFHTTEHLAISICEYADAKAAEAGAEKSREAFKAIEHRSVHVKRATTLTILENPADASSAAAKKKAVLAFDAL